MVIQYVGDSCTKPGRCVKPGGADSSLICTATYEPTGEFTSQSPLRHL